MRALIVTDLHGHRSIIGKVDTAIKEYKTEYLICCGDLTSSTTDNSVFLLELEKMINDNDVKFLTICGNADSPNIREYLIEKSWHLDETIVDGRDLIGSDFGYEEEFVTKRVAGKLLFTHVPPKYSTLEKPLENCPIGHFAGHRHQVESDRTFPSTRLVQIKSAQLGRAAILELSDLKVRFIDLI